MLYSYIWQHMQPLVKQKAKVKASPRKVSAKVRARLCVAALTLEQRREKLKSLKAKSKCMRCGALGHWAGDPECKFPTSQGKKGKAHLAIIAHEGLSIPAGNESAAAFVVRAAAAKPIAAPAHEEKRTLLHPSRGRLTCRRHGEP